MSRWSFSENGSSLFIFWVFVPILVRNIEVFFLADTFSGQLVLLVIFLLLATLLYYLSIDKIIKKRIWNDLVAWYQSTFAMSMVYLFYGSFIYFTGMSPSKYHSVPVDKGAGLYYVFYAAVFAIIGVGTYLKNRLKR